MMNVLSRSPWLRRIPTGSPRSTTVSGAGFWARMRPAGSRGVWTWVSLPLVRPDAWRMVRASSRGFPARSGTVTTPLPELVRTWTTVVTRMREPAAGSWRQMRPFSTRSLDSEPLKARERSFLRRSARAWRDRLADEVGDGDDLALEQDLGEDDGAQEEQDEEEERRHGRVKEESLRHLRCSRTGIRSLLLSYLPNLVNALRVAGSPARRGISIL